MPEPIEFRVVQHLQAALQVIAVASGYHYTVAALAVKLDAETSVEALIGATALRPFVILELPADEFRYQPANRLRLAMPFVVHAIHDSNLTDDNDFLRTYFRLCADVEQAVTQDLTRGGLVTDTRIESRECPRREGSLVWAQLSGAMSVPRVYGAPNG